MSGLEAFDGKWKFTNQENISAFLKSVGAAEEIAQKLDGGEVEIENAGNNKMHFKNSLGMDYEFEFGKEFEQRVFTLTVKVTVTHEGNKMIKKGSLADGSQVEIVYEVNGDALVETYTHGETKATLNFEKVKSWCERHLHLHHRE